jgi:hypothetical protein
MKVDAIMRLLPGVIQEAASVGTPLYGFLSAMELLQADAENIIGEYRDRLGLVVEGDMAFASFIAQWLDLDTLYKFSESAEGIFDYERLKNMITCAMDIFSLRGTDEGIVMALRTMTGRGEFEIKQVAGDPFHFIARGKFLNRKEYLLAERIVMLLKPAHTTFEVKYAAEVDR